MSVSYDGIGYLAVTMPADNCVEGQVCTLSTAGKAAACSSAGMFCGVVTQVENSMASVQLEGFVEVGYSGTAPTTGMITLAANGSGGVAVNTSGRVYLVVSVDTTAKTIVMKL